LVGATEPPAPGRSPGAKASSGFPAEGPVGWVGSGAQAVGAEPEMAPAGVASNGTQPNWSK
jgi:hypothetical protein